MNYKLAFAIMIQLVVFGTFFYLDSWATVEPSWTRVKNVALHPVCILLYGLTTVGIWWSYRVIYNHFHSFWTGTLFSGALLCTVHIGMAYLGSKILPNKSEMVGLLLALLATIVSTIKW